MKLGIKETLEALKAIELLGVSGVEIAKDGLGMDDMPKAFELVKQSSVLVEGFKGLDQIDDELKDLEQEELIQLGLEAFSMVKKIAQASKSLTEAK